MASQGRQHVLLASTHSNLKRSQCCRSCSSTPRLRCRSSAASSSSLSPSLVNFLIFVFVAIASSNLLEGAMSAPTGGSQEGTWKNPCGINRGTSLASSDEEIPTQTPEELFTQIELQANLSKQEAVTIADRYVHETFNDPNFPEYSKELSYKWLPQIQDVTDDYLESIEEGDALRTSYKYMQYYAVGIEQILQDQILYDGDFLGDFSTIDGKLRQVLCELQLAMLQSDVAQDQDVERDVMDQQYRDLDSKTARDLRDYIILRDFISALDYVSRVFAHFKAKAKAATGSAS